MFPSNIVYIFYRPSPRNTYRKHAIHQAMFSVCIPGRKSKRNLVCVSRQHPGNTLCDSYLFHKNTKNQTHFHFQMQTNKIIVVCFPFVSVGNSLHVFRENRDFTCFLVPLFLENSLHLQQCIVDHHSLVL